jgi:hypothetical protein
MLDLDAKLIESVKSHFDDNNVDLDEFIRIMRAHLDSHIIKDKTTSKAGSPKKKKNEAASKATESMEANNNDKEVDGSHGLQVLIIL